MFKPIARDKEKHDRQREQAINSDESTLKVNDTANPNAFNTFTNYVNLNRTQNSLFLTRGPKIANYLTYLQQQDEKFPKDKAKFLRVNTLKDVTAQKLKWIPRIGRNKKTTGDNLKHLRRHTLKQNLSKIQDMATDEIMACMREEMQQLLFTIQKCVEEYSDQQGTQLIQMLIKFNKKLFLKCFMTDDMKFLKKISDKTLDKLMTIIQRELFLNSQGSKNCIDYETQNINKLYQLIIFDIGYLQEKFQNYVSMRLNQKLDVIQNSIIDEKMEIINIKKDIVRNKQHLLKDHPEIKLEKIDKDVCHTRYRLEEKLNRMEINNGKFKKIHKISRIINNQIDEFSSKINANQQQRYEKEYFFTPIVANKIM